MKQDAFEKRYEASWRQFESCVSYLTAGRSAEFDAEVARLTREFPARYRQLCHHLALARARRYSAGLEQRLNELVLDGHRHLYRARTPLLGIVLRFAAVGFPRAFRRHGRYVLAAALLFCVPLAGMALAISVKPELTYSLIDPADVAELEAMYDPANRVLGRERESEDDAVMFGHYIANNIGIGFRTFAGGLLFGLGSMFFLVLNGLFIGAVAAYLTLVGYSSTFWPFVSTHSAFELTAIVIFGAAGLMIGMAALAPGRQSRWSAIRTRAREAMPLVYGGTAMLVAAAFIEAFWSSTTWPAANVKFATGAACWILTIGYFAFMGRNET